MKTKVKLVVKCFKAALERMPSNLGWVIARIPLDVPKVWGTRGMLKVKGEINGFRIRTSLFPTGKGYHYLLRAMPGVIRRIPEARLKTFAWTNVPGAYLVKP